MRRLAPFSLLVSFICIYLLHYSSSSRLNSHIRSVLEFGHDGGADGSRTWEIVVARYREDLQWLSSIPDSWQVTVYNKVEAERLQQCCAVSTSLELCGQKFVRWALDKGEKSHIYCKVKVIHKLGGRGLLRVPAIGDPWTSCVVQDAKGKFCVTQAASTCGAHRFASWEIKGLRVEGRVMKSAASYYKNRLFMTFLSLKVSAGRCEFFNAGVSPAWGWVYPDLLCHRPGEYAWEGGRFLCPAHLVSIR